MTQVYIIIHLFTYLKEGLICFFHSLFTLFINSCTLYCLPKKIGYPAVLISGMYWLNFYCCVSISYMIFPRESLTWDCYCICYEMDVEEMEVDGTENHSLRNDKIPKTLCGLDFCFHVFNKMYIDDIIALEQCDVIPGKHVILFRRFIDSRLT